MTIYYLSTTFFSDTDLNVLKNIVKGHKVIYTVIFSKSNANYSKEELQIYCDQYNIEFIPVQLKYRHRNPLNLIAFLKIIQSIKQSNADILYAFDFNELYLNTVLYLFQKTNNTIIGVHDVQNHSGTKNSAVSGFAKNLLLRKFKYFQTFSKVQQNILLSRNQGQQVFSIPLGLKDFGPKPEVSKPEAFTSFLFFGNVMPYKGLANLISCINQLAQKYSNFRLVIAGRAPNWAQEYAPLITAHANISANIGFINNEDIPTYFSHADYLILPYKDVTQSGPLTIAYQYNVPVIATNLEGFREFIYPDETGYLCNPDVEHSLYLQLENAINRSTEEYELLTHRLAETVKREFSDASLHEQYNRMFSQVASALKQNQKESFAMST